MNTTEKDGTDYHTSSMASRPSASPKACSESSSSISMMTSINAGISKRSQHQSQRVSIASGNEKPQISSWDAGWNVTNSIQGMFVLGLPYAVMYGGYWGLLLIILTAGVCCYTGKILVQCLYEKRHDGNCRVRESYVDIAAACWGPCGGYVINAAQLIEMIMTCVLYIVVSGNLMASSFPKSPINEAVWSTLVTMLLIPCIFLKNLRTVSKLSLGCTAAQAIVIVITILHCLTRISSWAWSEISLSINPTNFPVAIGVIVFSYTSQIFLPSLEDRMEKRRSFNTMLYWSYGVACVSKFIFALLCFLTWSSSTKEVITDSLPPTLRMVISFVLVAKALLSYPLPYYACVEVLEQTLFNGRPCGVVTITSDKAHPYENLTDEESPSASDAAQGPCELYSSENNANEKTGLNSVTSLLHQVSSPGSLPMCYTSCGTIQHWAIALRLLLVVGTYLIALFIPHFALLMGLTGSLTGSTLAFIFPSAFYLQLQWPNLKGKEIIWNITIIVVGLICCVSGIYNSIQGLYSSYRPRTAHVLGSAQAFAPAGSLNSTWLPLLGTTPSTLNDLMIFNEPRPAM